MATDDNALGTQRLSDLLLRGWIMNSDACLTAGHSVPTMRAKGGSENLCVLCDEARFEALGIKLRGTRAKAQSAQASTPAPEAANAAVSTEVKSAVTGETSKKAADKQPAQEQEQQQQQGLEQRKRTNEVSQLLGEKMLQGWALLEEACVAPNCIGVPLMRNHEQQTVCISCGARYLTEAQANQMGLTPGKTAAVTAAASHQKGKAPQDTAEPAQPRSASPPAVREMATRTSNDGTDDDVPAPPARRPRLAMSVTEEMDSGVSSTMAPALHGTLQHAYNTLDDVMDKLLKRIILCESAQQCQELADAIASVAAALKVCAKE
ncbi:hypothetical protein THASP1DRAFT_30617 [Thamnocephalis sphaerospora]|uniref:Uncharacterized protein n=1 Tax=Thamnocephalis sphaerospora TaxID=78915 RepID=A0A4P9XNN1_9FUNG|nr:hypothetical protein THASP1DRAFT_30617 [Thamnocephalis sphaerospora]|eukprot:RKP07566.1 hypothetical protein THASP1DRAFT_30617 [Thamnocephalis sphaerospora]